MGQLLLYVLDILNIGYMTGFRLPSGESQSIQIASWTRPASYTLRTWDWLGEEADGT